MTADQALEAALLLAKTEYQRDVLTGAQRLSGSDLKGTARKYAGRYHSTRLALLARIAAAGIPFRVLTGDRGLKFLAWGDEPQAASTI